ncbi:MAG TPA: FAD-dependent oxidoreductase [Solirubrobacteraceae bacterium]|nr:FAD-dependent oxidoreductase [Solirubrobacteraceae bacterium]
MEARGERRRVLVTDGETRAVVAAARGLRAAGFEVGIAAAQSSRPAPAQWSRSVAERILLPHPLEDEPAFVARLGAALASGSYSVLMPGSDASLRAVSRARHALEPHAKLGLPSEEAVERSLDKLALTTVAPRHGLDSPKTVVCATVSDALAAVGELGYPVVVKPICSIVDRGGVGLHVESRRVVDDTALTVAAALTGEPFLLQRVQRGVVISYAGVLAGGRFLGSAMSRYRRTWYPVAGNACFSETLPQPPELSARVLGLLAELGWEGLFELELIERGDGEWAAIDLNPRPYGSMALAIGSGANLPALWCSYLLGLDPPQAHVRARAGVSYRWEDADLRHAIWRLRAGQIAGAAAVLRMRRRVVHPYFSLRDPGPFLARWLLLARSLAERRRRPRPVAAEQRVPGRAARIGSRIVRPTARVAVIGAGPHGLATVAHLRGAGVDVRCFGDPLGFWRHNMPTGMILRSPVRATHIADPKRDLTIERYEQDTGRFVRRPSLLLEEFRGYGAWFQQQVVPDVDLRRVAEVRRSPAGFALRLDDGETLEASHVVVATGTAPFANRPEPFASLPASLVSHSIDHETLASFAGKRVAVIGGGQSALESAALLSEAGAHVEVLARAAQINWLSDDSQPSASARRRIDIPLPPTAVGGRLSGWIAAAPDAFRLLPASLKPWVFQRCLRPAGSGWLRPRLERVVLTCGVSTAAAQPHDDGVRLELDDGSERIVDQVLLGTGFAIDVSRYPLLAADLAAEMQTSDGYPRLGPGLESSVDGLHFVGAAAALSFGPVMRFVVGSWYAAPAVTLRILGRRQRPLNFSF